MDESNNNTILLKFFTALLGIIGILAFVAFMKLEPEHELRILVLILGILIIVISIILAQITPKIKKVNK